MLQARDGGSMHRLEYLNEAARLHNYLLHNFTVQVPSTGETFVYGQICRQSCDANIVIEYFNVSFYRIVGKKFFRLLKKF